MIYIVRYLEPNCRIESLARLEANNWTEALEKTDHAIEMLNKELNKESEDEYRLSSVQAINTLKDWDKN